MKNINQEILYKITSLSFFIFILVITFFIFKFLDILIFEFTRSFHGFIFLFFKEIIDPLSDIFDPINIIIICIILIL